MGLRALDPPVAAESAGCCVAPHFFFLDKRGTFWTRASPKTTPFVLRDAGATDSGAVSCNHLREHDSYDFIGGDLRLRRTRSWQQVEKVKDHMFFECVMGFFSAD